MEGREEAKKEEYSHDIFLSFRGIDIRHTFANFLYKSLCDRGFNPFIDDEGLERGEGISDGLFKAIEKSKVCIVIFSENYASSRWCLRELVKILEWNREKKETVWPIFFKVEPADVRHQNNSYQEAMAKHAERYPKKIVDKWKSALKEAADLRGWTFKTGYEYNFITAIIKKAFTKIRHKYLYIEEHIIELESCLKEVNSLLDIQHDDTVRMVGIFGIGGIGKTTLTKVLYNKIVDQFDYGCFLESVGQRSNSSMDLVNVQEKLLSKIHANENFKLGNVEEGANVIKGLLRNKKVLLVLDDVDKKEQLQKLAGACDWFGLGSRIIITTRNQRLLRAHRIERRHEVKGLDSSNALKLFCSMAFKSDQPNEGYFDISKQIIEYCKGLPLALEVIGSNLFGRSLKAWESAFDKYQRIPDRDIISILKISYDRLEDDQKTIFLDIACLFKGKKWQDVEEILDACDLSPQYNIEVLVDLSLITIDEFNNVGMHDLIQDMGEYVVKQDASFKLDQYSRLWNQEDIVNVLATNSGSDNIQLISFCSNVPVKVEWSGTSFEKMKNLRILIIQNVEFSIGPKSLPNSLRVLEWHKYPSEYLPEGFYPIKILHLKLPNSGLISLNPLQKLENLTYVDFSHSKLLTKIPDVSGSMNITTLKLEGCTNLKEVHDSVGVLPKLLNLSLEGCINLEIFPHGIEMTSLERLNLNYCKSLQYFPEILGKMDKLYSIRAQWTGIKQIPHSICYLSGLEFLFISNNDELLSLPASITQLDKLIHLYVENCKKLRHISGIPPNIKRIRADGCISLSSQSLIILWSQALQAREFLEVAMPKTASHCKTVIPNWFDGDFKTDIPNWFDHQHKGGSISFGFPGNLLFFAWAVVFGKSTDAISSKSNGTWFQLICKVDGCLIVDKHFEYDFKEGGTLLTISYIRLSECVGYTNVHNRYWHHVEMECKIESLDQEVDECGVLDLYQKPNMKMEDDQFENSFPNEGSMSRNDEKNGDAKPGKVSVMPRNDKKLEGYKLPRRFFKDGARVGIHTCWRRQAFPPLFFSKHFKSSPSFLSI